MSLVDVRVLDFACPLISSFSKCLSSLMEDASSHAQQLEFIGYHFDEPDDQSSYLKNHFLECLEKDFLFKQVKDSYNVVHLNKSFSNLANLRRRTVQGTGKPPGQAYFGLKKQQNYQSKIDPVVTDKQFLSPSGIEFSGLGFFGNEPNRGSDQPRESLVINRKPDGGSSTPIRETLKAFEKPHSSNPPPDVHVSARATADQPRLLQSHDPPEEFTLKGTEKSDKGTVEKLGLPEEPPMHKELKDSRHMFSEFPECRYD
jgi:hypothetical protein